MDRSMRDRRLEPRVPAGALTIVRATLRPGCHVEVVDLSPTGVQVESRRPLRPGTRVHVRLSSTERTLSVAAVVLRCAVWAVDPEAGVTYRGGLRFEERCVSFCDDYTPGGCVVRTSAR
jgi:hypothetical protein